MRTRASITLTKLSGKVHSWTDKKLSSARAWLRKLTKELAKELDGYKWLSGVLLLPCLILWTKSTLILLAVVGVVLASVHYGKFLWWAHKWSQRLVADRREIPSLRELGKVRETIKKREKTLADHWPDRCTMNGLRRVPVLLNVQPTLDLDLTAYSPRTGVDPDDIKAKAPKIAKGLGCSGGIVVREVGTGDCEIRFNWTDFMSRPLQKEDWPMSPSGRIAYGIRPDGSAATVEFLSTFIGGLTRHGKSKIMRAQMVDINRQEIPVNYWVSNPKGVEFRALGKYVGQQMGHMKVVEYVDNAEDTAKMVDRMAATMMQQKATQKTSDWKLSPETPLNVFVGDEALPLHAMIKEEHKGSLGKIAYVGSGLGYVAWLNAQVGHASVLGILRNFIPQRLSVATPTPQTTDTILGDGAEARGAFCSRLNQRGVGFSESEGSRDIEPFRVPLFTDEDMEYVALGKVPPGTNMTPTKEQATEAPEQRVYFIEAQGTDLVKVGIAAEPTGRLKELQTASPHKLAILATMPGGRAKEYQLHRRFASSRATGEWFHRTPELDALIAEVQSGAFEDVAPGRHPVQHARQWIGDKRAAHREAHPVKPVHLVDDLWWEKRPAWKM